MTTTTDTTQTPFDQPNAKSSDPEGGTGAYSFDGKPDRWRRYRLPHPETGKADGWTRATTFAKSISDTFTLSQWSQRMVAWGLSQRPDLLMSVASASIDDRDTLNRLAEQAKDAAGAKVGANLGTAIHAFTEMIDRGEKPVIPAAYQPHVAAWSALLQRYNLEVLDIERVVLCLGYDDPDGSGKRGVAGTLDRVCRFTKDTTIEAPGGVTHTFPAGTTITVDLKGLALDTPLPTPTGWTTMGEVQEGDQVLGADGRPCNVTAKSRTKRIGTYIVRFDDGSEITCDSEHLWQTTIGHGRQAKTEVRGIEDILKTLDRKGRKQHKIPVADPLVLPEAYLPIDPYMLGVWLGDGAVRDGTVTKTSDLFEVLASDEVEMGVEQRDSRRSHVITRTILGLRTQLIAAGLTHNKHIPAPYLRGSFHQRLRLLQGLMDTDGTWNTARRTAVFSTCDEALARQVEELALALGQKPRVSYYKRSGFGLEVDSWTVEMTPVGINPFRLPRKASQAAMSTKNTTMASRRVIVGVEPGPDVETACIAVDSPDHLYLAGRRMVPTHNTGRSMEYGGLEISIQLAVYANAQQRWDKEKGEWLPQWQGMNTDFALVVHIPATAPGETVEAAMMLVDIRAGHELAQLCTAVRTARKRKNLMVKLSVVEELPVAGPMKAISPPHDPTWDDRVANARTTEEVTDVWLAAMAKGAHTPELMAKLRARRAAILADTAAG